jgi:hypothetical protein
MRDPVRVGNERVGNERVAWWLCSEDVEWEMTRE